MNRILLALCIGVLFGGGLAFSGMADPARVQGFFDLFGNWDPTLLFVMAGALIPMAAAWAKQKRMRAPTFDTRFDLPGTMKLDRQLFGGAALFGVGWGISGLCPGPAIVDLAINPVLAALFIFAMIAGMTAHRFTT